MVCFGGGGKGGAGAGMGGALLGGLGLIGGGAMAGHALGGTGGAIVGGGLGLATAGSLGLLGTLGAFGAMAGPIGAVIAGVAGLTILMKKLFTNTPFEAGSKEISRDFGGVNVGKRDVNQFVGGSLGITQQQFKGQRKDILSSGKFLEEVLIPAAMSTGEDRRVDRQLRSLRNGLGYFRLYQDRSVIAVESGDFTAYNAAWARSIRTLTAVDADVWC